MISEYTTIIADLKKYLIKGIHLDTTAISFNGDSFDSTVINGLKYKFILKYEDAANITERNIIPVLLITTPDQYFKGKILYKGQFVDITTLLIKQQNTTEVIPKINFFVIPHIIQIDKGNFGSIFFDLKIDYVTDFDTYGIMSKEIDSLLKLHYFRTCPGEHHYITSQHTNLYFLPKSERVLNQDSLLNRLSQLFDIRFCKLV